MNVALKTNDWSNIQIKQQMPNFEIFLQNLENMDSKKIKFILFLYANIYADFTENANTAKLQIEHILPKQWQNANFNGWNENLHNQYLEQIGNKILLPDKINIKCSDHFFAKKQDGYKKITDLKEVYELGIREKKEWLKEDIESRNKEIYQRLNDFFTKHI